MSEPNITEIAQDDPRLAELSRILGMAGPSWPLTAEQRALLALERRVGALERQLAALTPGIAPKGPEGGA